MNTFSSLSLSRKGKSSDKWSSYLDFYDIVLDSLKVDVRSILEIGVQSGGSLETWATAFPKATSIVGADIDPACEKLTFEDHRIQVVIGDATSSNVAQTITSLAPSFEIVVDDGSHVSRDTIKSFGHYFPHVAPGGAYVIEDLHCSYWPDWGGGLLEPESAIAFFKRLIDVVNSEHWIESIAPVEVLQGFMPDFSPDEFATLALALPRIKSIEFFDSMCVVHTYVEVPAVRLGSRLLLGGNTIQSDARVARLMQEPTSQEAKSSLVMLDPAFELRAWVALERSPKLESQVVQLESQVVRLETAMAKLSGALTESELGLQQAEAQLRSVLNSRSWRWSRGIARLIGR
jgi:uncharacterized coiled-coil protein SlyX